MCDKSTLSTPSPNSLPFSWGDGKGGGEGAWGAGAGREKEEVVTQEVTSHSCCKAPRAAALPGAPASASLRTPAAYPVGAAQPRSPRPTVLHHGTRRSQPPCFQRETTAHVVFIEQGGREWSHREWSLKTSSGQFCTGGETEARRGSAEPRHGGSPALPGLLLAQTTEPRCPPGFQGFGVVYAGGFKPSSPASYRLCDLWKGP